MREQHQVEWKSVKNSGFLWNEISAGWGTATEQSVHEGQWYSKHPHEYHSSVLEQKQSFQG